LANQEDAARVYFQRLQILEPNAPLEPAALPAAKAQVAVGPKPAAVRGYRPDEDDPFRRMSPDPQKAARDYLARAEQEFGSRRYHEADLLFEQAARTDRAATRDSRERWAYCKLHQV